MRRRLTVAASGVVFLLVLALIFPPFPRTWRSYATYALVLIAVVPIAQWWFQREIRIGQEKLRARDEGSRSAR